MKGQGIQAKQTASAKFVSYNTRQSEQMLSPIQLDRHQGNLPGSPVPDGKWPLSIEQAERLPTDLNLDLAMVGGKGTRDGRNSGIAALAENWAKPIGALCLMNPLISAIMTTITKVSAFIMGITTRWKVGLGLAALAGATVNASAQESVATATANAPVAASEVASENGFTLSGAGISSKFTIRQPYFYLDVKGKATQKARVELLIDGELNRYVEGGLKTTQTVCIDVAHLIGQDAQISVAVEGVETKIRWMNVPLKRYQWTPQDFGIEPKFIQDCQFFTTPAELQTGRRLPVGLSPGQFDYAINEVFKRMIQPDMDHVPGRSVKDLAAMISQRTDEVISRLKLTKNPPLLRKWLLAEGVCGWVSTHMVYDAQYNEVPDEVKISTSRPKFLLAMEQPAGNCGCFNGLTRMLLEDVGITCKSLGGDLRFSGAGEIGHGWNFIDFGGGICFVADNSEGRISLQEARSINGKTKSYQVLPKTPAEFEFFLLDRFANRSFEDFDSQGDAHQVKDNADYSLLRMSYREWLTISSRLSAQITDLRQRAHENNARFLNQITDIRNIWD